MKELRKIRKKMAKEYLALDPSERAEYTRRQGEEALYIAKRELGYSGPPPVPATIRFPDGRIFYSNGEIYYPPGFKVEN